MLGYKHETISRILVLVPLNTFITGSQYNYNETEFQHQVSEEVLTKGK